MGNYDFLITQFWLAINKLPIIKSIFKENQVSSHSQFLQLQVYISQYWLYTFISCKETKSELWDKDILYRVEETSSHNNNPAQVCAWSFAMTQNDKSSKERRDNECSDREMSQSVIPLITEVYIITVHPETLPWGL